MNTNKRTGVIVGILYIIGTVAGILSVVFTGLIRSAQDPLLSVSANEAPIMVGALFVLTMGLALAMVLVVVVGAGAVLATGLVYMLGSQPAWRHVSVPVALFADLLILGVSLALVIALGWRGSLLGLSVGEIAALVLVLVGVCALGVAAWGYALHLSAGGLPTAGTHRLLEGRYRRSHRLGLALVMVAGIAAAVSFVSPWAIIAAFLASLGGLFVMRRLFFVTAAPLTWKSEVHWSLPPEVAAGEG